MKWLNCLKIRLVLIVFVVAFVMSGLTQADTITVGPGAGYDFDSIQAGIDAANNGDEVLVAPGEYIIAEPITFRGKAITVISEAGSEQTTIRMGTPADPERASVLVFENNETLDSVLDGFTITGGSGCRLRVPERAITDWMGGGVCFYNASSGTIKNCAIVQNQAKENSGGVLVYSRSSAILTNCIISGNVSMEDLCGGVCCAFDSSLTMTDCIISENSSEAGAGGGVAGWYSSLTLTRCAILSNTAGYWFGGGVYAGHSSATLTNCIIARNTAALGGGGVASSYPETSLAINNCTIWGNSGGASYGGGGVLCRQASATVTNSIIWGNTAPKGREISLEVYSPLDITYSNVAGGKDRVYVDDSSTLSWGEGNIDADPLFAEPGYWADINYPNIIVEPDDPNAVWIDGDYHLKSEAGRWDLNSESWVLDNVTSPCIDRGDPNSPVAFEPIPNGGIINMGAYGGTPEASMSIGPLQPLPPPPPLAHWKLDEAEGTIAHDSGCYDFDGILIGDPLWQPDNGMVDGALQFDGIDDYIGTPFILNPARKFSVFAWVKGGAPGQVVLSQTGRSNWLLADPSEGKLMTELAPPAGRFVPPPLVSEFVITDGQWHRIGFVWDGSYRTLYVDDVEVAKDQDVQSTLEGALGGLYIGTGKSLEAGSFFSGLIDDVRIYNRAVIP